MGCAACGVESAGSGMMSEGGEVYAACFDEVDVRGSATPPAGIVGLIAGVVPFLAHPYVASGGVFIDYVAVAGGVVAMICAVVVVVAARRSPWNLVAWGWAVACGGLAVVQLLRGFGVLMIGYE